MRLAFLAIVLGATLSPMSASAQQDPEPLSLDLVRDLTDTMYNPERGRAVSL
jgi:outer membrane protein assembly factor BamA